MTAPDWPKMMKRGTAAMYCDLSQAEFEREVHSGRLPMPVKLGNSEHWSRTDIDEHLSRLTKRSAPSWRDQSPLYANG